jgi:hypothetical protein
MDGNLHNREPLSAVTGGETDAELRDLIVKLTQKYSGCHNRQKCMLRVLSGLTYISLGNLVKGFSRELCVEILNSPCACQARDLAHSRPFQPGNDFTAAAKDWTKPPTWAANSGDWPQTAI